MVTCIDGSGVAPDIYVTPIVCDSMTGGFDTAATAVLSPDEAFSVLGNETRLRILQTLGDADSVLSFTELRDRVGIRQGEQFNYHLDKVVGHFVHKTETGYVLGQPGRRVIEAVLSGAVTTDPYLDPTVIDQSCYHCDAPIEVGYRHERVGLFCTECRGNYGGPVDRQRTVDQDGRGRLGYQRLPPAGVQGRTADGVLAAAFTWGNLQFMARASGVCPRCSASLDESVVICEKHDTTDGVCDACDNRYAVQHHAHCTNCIYDSTGIFMLSLLANTELLAFLTTHGLNPVSASSELAVYAVTGAYEETILSVDPFEARFTFTVDQDAITLTVDESLAVVDVSK